LARDRWTCFEYPDRSHRCYAGKSPEQLDINFQAQICLSPAFGDCVRYRMTVKPATESTV
jgi:hypothetical protein